MRSLKTLHFETVSSTLDLAKEQTKNLSPNAFLCIQAEEQTAGRGRFQRSWSSPKGVNLYPTFCFSLPHTFLHFSRLTQLMTYTIAQLLQKLGVSPKVKWPNDVQLNQKKVCGVLCELESRSPWVHVFLGVGLNVNMKAEDLQIVGQPATSLLLETGRLWDRKALLEELQKSFLTNLSLFETQGFSPFQDSLQALLAYRGESIRCFDGEKVWEGVCLGIDADGRLQLQLPNGSLHLLSSGDLYS